MIDKLSLLLLIKHKTVPMFRGIITVLFSLSVSVLLAQTTGDYRSAVATGTWDTPGTWETYVGATWIPAVTAPSGVATANNINILSGHTITITTSVTADQLTVDAGGILVISGPSVTLSIDKSTGSVQDLLVNGTVTINDGILNAGSATAIIRVGSGGIMNCNGQVTNTTSSNLVFEVSSVFDLQNVGGSVPTANWDPTSICRITADYSGANLGLAGQTFGIFEWNTPTLTSQQDLGGSLTQVAGNLDFVNTGGSLVFLNQSTPAYALDVSGNVTLGASARVGLTGSANSTINVSGTFTTSAVLLRGSNNTGTATVNVTGATNLAAGTLDAGSSTGTTILNLAGNYTNTGTSLVKTGSPATGMSMNFNGTSTQTFTSTNVPAFPVNFSTTGTSNLAIAATSFVAGTGTLTVGAGTSLTLLSVLNTGALRNGTTSGAVRVAGTRTYNGTIVYGAAARQYMSTDHPGTASTRINNAVGVNMLGSVAFTTGTLDLDNGHLYLVYSSTLTVSTVLHNGGFLGVDANSSIVINGSGAYGNLALTHISGTSIKNLTINRASGSVNQTTPTLAISGTLTLSAGTLALGINTINTVSGPFVVTGGNITGTNSTRFSIAGSGAMPAGVSITGSLHTLAMTRVSSSLNLSNTSPNFVDVGRLNLTAGTINNAGGLRMANGGLITRTNGSLLAAIAAVGSYSVIYSTFSAADLVTGFEIPSSGTALSGFTVNNTLTGAHVVHLNQALNARGVITITAGGLATENNNVNVGGNFTIAAAGSFTPGSSTITFDGSVIQSFSGPVAYTFNNVIVAKTGGYVNINTAINITTSFAVNTATRANVGTNRVTLLSTSAATAYVPALPSGASIVGSVIVQRHLPNNKATREYRYISSPTTNATVADWQAELPISGTFTDPSSGYYDGVLINSTNPSLFYYNETLVTGSMAQTKGYVNYPSCCTAAAAPLVNGRGYAAFGRTTGELTLDTRGTLKQQNLDMTVTHSGGVNGGFNLVGNPYAAPIDWDLTKAATGVGVDDQILFIDNNRNVNTSGGIVTYANGVSVPAGYSGNIASSQAFWVKVTNPGSATLKFRENQKAPLQTQFIREGETPNLLRIFMKSGTETDQIAIRLIDDATEDFDSKYDAIKFGVDGLLNISTLSKNNVRLTINSIGNVACDTKIPFFIDGATTGTYTFDFTGIESFQGNANLVLFDKVLNTRTAISTASHYEFSVSDASLAENRFELLIEGPPMDTELLVAGENICEGNSATYVTLQSSQTNVKYTALINGETISTEIEGNGGALQIPINIEVLPKTFNEITISAKSGSCDSRLLTQKASIEVIKKTVITTVSHGTTCVNDKVTLGAVGLDANLYNWYESAGDLDPIAEQHGNEFTTPVLTKSKTYYVAAVNKLGCEGPRVEVKADVVTIAPVTTEVKGNVLTSSYTEGNQWYLDGLPIDDATSVSFEAAISGTYSVAVSTRGCTAVSAGREMLISGMAESDGSFISIYPNPTTDKITMEIRTSSNNLEARMINANGVEIITQKLSGTSDVKTGEFNLSSYPAGIYMIRVRDGGKVYTNKVSKK